MNIGLNERCVRLIESFEPQFSELQVGVHAMDDSVTVLDFGGSQAGTLAGGLLLSRICLSDLALVNLTHGVLHGNAWPAIQVATDSPLLACMASQYAGWAVQHHDYFAVGSGPCRLLRGREEMLDEYALRESATHGVLILESDRLPGPELARALAAECGLETGHLTICVARTASFPGSTQIVARSIETTLHKLHELKFDLRQIRSAMGIAPLPPIGRNDLQSIGWTNDAILYGSQVCLWVDTLDETIAEVGPRIPSRNSHDYGRPFSEIFESYNRDFYKVDKALFSPAVVTINNLKTGRTHRFGQIDERCLIRSFGIDSN